MKGQDQPEQRRAEHQDPNPKIKVKSLYKAISLLDCFMDGTPELGVTELAQKTGMLKSTVSNILATFEVSGIVEKDRLSGKYRMGVKLLEYSNQIYLDNNLRRVLHPVMERLANLCGETVYLATFYGTEIIYLDSIFPRSNSTGKNLIGLRAPAYCTGIGKALLAYQAPELIDKVIHLELNAFTENTIVTAEEMEKELKRIRQRGYAVDNMEHEEGIRCVACPVFDYEGNAAAAVSVSGAAFRFTDKKIEEYAYILKDQLSGFHQKLF